MKAKDEIETLLKLRYDYKSLRDNMHDKLTIEINNISEDFTGQVLDEMASGSITPTTLKERKFLNQQKSQKTLSGNFDKKKAEIDKKAKDIEDFFKSGKELFQNEIQQFEISVNPKKEYNSKLSGVYNSYNTYLENTKDIDTSIFEDVYGFNKTNVSRFGLNGHLELNKLNSFYNDNKCTATIETASVGSKSKSKSDNKGEVVLHPLEIMNLYKALIENKDKVVLVDIFARDDQGNILVQDNSKFADVHSIVLYKNGNKICVIDPSKSSHSNHIVSSAKFISDELSIVAPKEVIEIYVPKKGKTGPSQYRDCIDIAVKIALGLQEGKEVIDPNKLVESIKSLKIVQQVTNQEDVNKNLFFEKDIAVARIRQATNLEIKDKSDKLLKAFDDIIKKCKTTKVKEELIEKASKAFQKEYPFNEYDTCLKELLAQYKESQEVFFKDYTAFEGELESKIMGKGGLHEE